jgi:subtilisin family serine protease
VAGRGQVADDVRGREVVVTLAPGVDAATLASSYDAIVLRDDGDPGAALLSPPPGVTIDEFEQQLVSDPRVVTAEPNDWLETAESRQQSFAFDDGFGSAETFGEQPSTDAIHLAAAHEVALGEGVKVAILDTGIDPTHPMIRNVYAGGVDLVSGDNDPTEVHDYRDGDGDGRMDEAFGHGTHVAGIIHLVAPAAKLLAVRVLDDDGRGRLLDVVAGVRWAVAHGAKVINLSLGSLAKSDALQLALHDAKHEGVVVVTSAGNWGSDKPEEYPARSHYVAAVAAVDADASPARFSSYGDIVALSAPGVGVRSTYPGGGYRLWSGTSMAAPFVAGTCALLAEVHPDWKLSQMLGRLQGTTGKLRGKSGLKSSDFGAGTLDAGAALAPDLVSRAGEITDPEVGRRR